MKALALLSPAPCLYWGSMCFKSWHWTTYWE